MKEIFIYFLMFIISLILTFMNKITQIGGGLNRIIIFLEEKSHVLESLMYSIIYILELVGVILFVYSIIMFLFKSYIFLKRKNKN